MVNLNTLKNIYESSPNWLKRIYSFIPYDFRNGIEYRKWKNFLYQEICEEEYQILKLKETLQYAYDNTIYYRKLFDELDCSVKDINEMKDLKLLPFIDKNIVRENFYDIMSINFSKKNFFYVTTGGSTGEPMKFYQSNNIWKKELAFINYYFSRFGYDTSNLKASFRGGDFNELEENKFWKYNPINNEIHFSPFHINKKNIPYYVKQLNKKKPLFFHSYPSAILSLIENMQELSLSIEYDLNTIFLISENINPDEINIIADFFNCNVSSFYGHAERLILALSEDRFIPNYKIQKRYGAFELIDNNKNVIIENDVVGEVVGTSFDNFAMPLIRYKTNDFTSYSNIDNSLINLIEGRWNKEYLYGKDNTQITLTALNMHSNILNNIINFQFYQEKIGFVEVLIVPKETYSNKDKNLILNALNAKAKHAIVFSIKVISQPVLTKTGKILKLINTIKNKK